MQIDRAFEMLWEPCDGIQKHAWNPEGCDRDDTRAALSFFAGQLPTSNCQLPLRVDLC